MNFSQISENMNHVIHSSTKSIKDAIDVDTVFHL